MLRLFLLTVIPSIFALGLCMLAGNVLPALVVGGVCFAVFVVGIHVVPSEDDPENTEAVALLFLLIIPSLINAFFLLGGSGLYYLAECFN